jgi:hypothetical protein
VERFNLKKLTVMEVRKQYQIEISNFWRTSVIARTYIGLGKTLKRMSKSQLKNIRSL